MEIKVNEQPQLFPLAFNDGWKHMAGHEIKVGKYRFCVIPIKDYINVSEVTTGTKMMNIPVDLVTAILTETKEETIELFRVVGERIKKIIEKQEDFDEQLVKFQKSIYERLGEMPAIEDVEIGAITGE